MNNAVFRLIEKNKYSTFKMYTEHLEMKANYCSFRLSIYWVIKVGKLTNFISKVIK